MKRTDLRVLELFSHLRRTLDLLEDMVRHPYPPPEPAPPSPMPAPAPAKQESVDQSSQPMLVSVKEARKLIGASNTNIYRLINDGVLETVLIGHRRMVRYRSLLKLSAIERAFPY